MNSIYRSKTWSDTASVRHQTIPFCSQLLPKTGAATITRSHHERWEGSDYPDGLAGEAIPFVAHLFAVADVFDALTSERPSKHAWPVDETLKLMRDESGRYFDPELITAFFDNLSKILEIRARLDNVSENDAASLSALSR